MSSIKNKVRVKKKIHEDTKSQINTLEKIKNSEMLNELNLLHTEGISLVDPTDITASLKGRDKIYNHLEMLFKEAKNSIFLLTTEDGITRKLSELSKSMKKANDRGVKIKINAPITAKTKQILKAVESFADVKHTDIKGRFCVVDNKHLVFMLMDDNAVHPSYDTSVWANTAFFSKTLMDLVK